MQGALLVRVPSGSFSSWERARSSARHSVGFTGLHSGREPLPQMLSFPAAYLYIVHFWPCRHLELGPDLGQDCLRWVGQRSQSGEVDGVRLRAAPVSWAGVTRGFYEKYVLLTFVHLNCAGSSESKGTGEGGGQELPAQRGQAWACRS